MIRWHWYISFSGGATMPEFTTVSVQEAQLRTIPRRQGTFMKEYVDYIQQLPHGQAGRLTIGEGENHPTVRAAFLAGRGIIRTTQAKTRQKTEAPSGHRNS
jgi:hypothetical protein